MTDSRAADRNEAQVIDLWDFFWLMAVSMAFFTLSLTDAGILLVWL